MSSNISSSSLDNFLQDSINHLVLNHLERSLKTLSSEQGPWVEVEGKRVLNLSSNNYLGLAAHPRVKEAAARAAQAYGCGSGASRLLCGNMALHKSLEQRLASFKGKEAALLYSSGYAANVGVLSCLLGPGDYIFSDELNHASIVDGCHLSRARTMVYPHRDIEALERMLHEAYREASRARRLIVVDGVFSMDGDLAPLPELARLAAQYEAILMVDEAHATGTVGPQGQGVAAYFGLADSVPITMGTLSKALGSQGGFIAASRDMIKFLTNHSRSFIFSTALSPPAVGAALESLSILEANPSLSETLQSNAAYVRNGLKRLGFDILQSVAQIIPVIVGEAAATIEIANQLLAEGLLVSALRPPTVPKGSSRLRLSVMANHTREDLDFALAAIEKVGHRQGFI